MGYGDVFVAGVLGGVLAAEGRRQWPAGILVFVLAALWDLLFLVDSINTLPATVPIAVALIVVEAAPWLTRRRPGVSPAS
jgi:integral membrane sensor domain MASE1